VVVRIDKDEALEQLGREVEPSKLFGGCVMCRLASNMHAHEWIADSEHGVVVLDGYAATRGHLLVIAKRHVERGSDLEWEQFSDLQRLVWQACRVVETKLRPDRVYTASLGASKQLPMSFPHYHGHVVPIYETDERARPAHVFSWSQGVLRYSLDEARALRRQLRDGWTSHGVTGDGVHVDAE